MRILVPVGVDMKLARERAKKLRLMEYERDSRGVTIPGNEQLFSLFANPRNVGAENPGIGLYFHTVLMVALLLVALAALNMYPLIDNLSQDRYTVCAYEWRSLSSLVNSPNKVDTVHATRKTHVDGFVSELDRAVRILNNGWLEVESLKLCVFLEGYTRVC